ncbi:MAG TPA: EAL domain-containing protein [Hyphomicrobiaceae bacterium]|nr:EAL domain-containing protein [Hyphomicrobiaceae bacterium]
MLKRALAISAAAIYRNSAIVFGCMVAAGIWLGVFLHIRADYDNQQALVAEDMNGLTTVLQGHVVRTIKELDRAMLVVRDYVEVERLRNGGAVPWQKLRLPQPEVLGEGGFPIGLIDESGRLVRSNAPLASAGLDLADRPHFRVHLNSGGKDILYIAAPIHRPQSGRTTIQVTRPLLAEPGRFTGVISGTLEPDQLFPLHPPIAIGTAGSMSVLGLDGIVRASVGTSALMLGEYRADLALFEALARGADYGTSLDRSDGRFGGRFIAYRRLEDYPLVVLISKPEDEAMSAHYTRRTNYGLFAAALSLIVLFGSATGARYQRKLRKTAEELAASRDELARRNMLLDTALHNMSQGLAMFDGEERLILCNDRYAEMYRLPPEMRRPGTTRQQLAEYRMANGVYFVRQRSDDAARRGPRTAATMIRELTDGRVVCLNRVPMPGGGWVATHEDITERRQFEARIEHMAHYDGLTDLPNRVLFRERLERALAGTRRGDRPFAVMLLDLDRFKEVNDTLGHASGDALLKAVADRLRRCVRESDTVARLGGDEFAVLESVEDGASNAAALAERIVTALCTPFDLNGQMVSIGTSIGIALAPADGTDPDQLLKNADLALYRAKNDGGDTYRYFEPEMNRRMQIRRDLERDLRRAVANGELELHYLPLVNLKDDRICGFEALLRWNHPTHGRVTGRDLIPLAEETGLITTIGEWVLRQACTDAASWPEHLKVAVNISPAQFKYRNLVQTVVSALTGAGLQPQRLELEIAERVLLQDGDTVFAILNRLHELGVRIALDDFGTGYSSLSNLRRFPFDKVKIDRQFVSDLSEANVDAVSIVRAVARLGDSLGIATTAEGVETKEQLERVRKESCTEMQGYFIWPPCPAKEVAMLFPNHLPSPAPADAA